MREIRAGPLTVAELRLTLLQAVRVIHKARVSDDYKYLSENKPVNQKSKLRNLYPFMDQENIMRIGERL